jgi:putative transposase
MRFTFIAAHTEEFHVTTMCRVLKVKRAGYYAWVSRPPSARAMDDAQLAETIKDIHDTSRRTYGSPRVQEELKAQGQQHGEKRVARIMREEGLRAKTPRRFRVTTDSNHAHPIAPNVLDRQFAVAEGAALDRVWVGDITYLTTREGWLYLAIVLDLSSRRVIGWAMRHTLEGALTRDALTMALTGRQPESGVLHHSDRGSQYAAGDYQDVLIAHGMGCSMSRVGNRWDNAVAESFFCDARATRVPPPLSCSKKL